MKNESTVLSLLFFKHTKTARQDFLITIWCYSVWVNLSSNNIQKRLLPPQLSLTLSFSVACFDFFHLSYLSLCIWLPHFHFYHYSITIPHSFTASFLPLFLPPLLFSPPSPPCLDLLVGSVYFSLSVGVRFGTSGISSSLLSFNPAVLPEGIRRKAPGS